jgi:predicted DNA-binding transcriptional regulator AlpA
LTRYLTLREVSERLGGRSRSAIYADLQAGRLPQPLRLGGRVYWHEGELAAWLHAMATERAAVPADGAA